MLQAGTFEPTELYQARLLLEPGIAEIAAREADPDDVSLLRASLEEGRQRMVQHADTAPASYTFHFLLAKAAKSNLLLMLVSSLLDLVHKSDQEAGDTRRPSPSIVRAHEAIVSAIERHDADGARQATTEHLLKLQSQVPSRRQKLAS
jgi:GntR family transcriptional repressor for pyruvate dehydrogenase complex